MMRNRRSVVVFILVFTTLMAINCSKTSRSSVKQEASATTSVIDEINNKTHKGGTFSN